MHLDGLEVWKFEELSYCLFNSFLRNTFLRTMKVLNVILKSKYKATVKKLILKQVDIDQPHSLDCCANLLIHSHCTVSLILTLRSYLYHCKLHGWQTEKNEKGTVLSYETSGNEAMFWAIQAIRNLSFNECGLVQRSPFPIRAICTGRNNAEDFTAAWR